MSFLTPITGLMTASVGGLLVVLLYMLRLRRKPVVVSSTLLWMQSIRDVEGNIPWQRLSPSLLLWMHLLIVGLLSLAIAKPIWGDQIDGDEDVYVILDASASMSAVVDGESLFERARESAIDRMRAMFDAGVQPRVTVVVSAAEPRVVLRGVNRRGHVLESLADLRVTHQPGDLSSALNLANRLASERSEALGETGGQRDGPDSQLLVYSDGDGLQSSDFVFEHGGAELIHPVPINRSAESGTRLQIRNAGIVSINAMRDRSDPELCRVFVRVDRSQHGPEAVIVRVFDTRNNELGSMAVSFDDDVSVSGTIELRTQNGGLLKVQLDGVDDLDADQQAWVHIPRMDDVRVSLMTPDGRADAVLVEMLEVVSDSSVRLVKGADRLSEQTLRVLGSSSIVVYEQVEAVSELGVPSIRFGVPSVDDEHEESNMLSRQQRQMRPLSWDRDDSLVKYASLSSLRYQNRVPLHSREGGEVLASDRVGPMIVEFVEDSVRHVDIAFAFHDSNWGTQVGFPIFLSEAFDRLLPGFDGIGTVYPIADYPSSVDSDRSLVGEYMVGDEQVGLSVLDADESQCVHIEGFEFGSIQPRLKDEFVSTQNRESSTSTQQLSTNWWRWLTISAVVVLILEWVLYLRSARV